MTVPNAAALKQLKGELADKVLSPGDAGYEAARTIWNATIDRRPGAIVRCADTADVMRVVNFARDNALLLAVRGGGHNIAGLALCDDGIVVDLSRMKAVSVDAGARTATVEGGATLADVGAGTQAHGLAVPLGINSTTGIAGLMLGGGFGWLSRKHGMTVDNFDWAEVVTAAGEVVHASENEQPDLFWALRGGGNFGVVTRFGFRLHPVRPDVLSGLIVYPLAEAKTVLRQYRDFMLGAPDELSVWTVLRQAPPLPFLPAEAHGQGMVALALLYAGDPKQGEALIEPLRRFGKKPVGEHVGVQPYAAWQEAFDPLLAPGARNYWKSHNFSKLDDALFDVVIDAIGRLPSPECEIFFGAIGGATARPTADATAYAHRETRYVMNVHGRWQDAADDGKVIAWGRDFFKASAPFAGSGVYVNFLTADEGDRVRTAYGPNHDRLVQAKRRYDPQNLFRVNQNIMPG